MKKILVLLQIYFLLAQGLVSYGQKNFVTFETTNNNYVVCQGSVLGIIASINSEYKGVKSFGWNFDKENVNKTQDEIVTVNTSKPGEKKLVFSIILNSGEKLDTAIYVKVLPRPDIKIQVLNNSIVVKNSINIDSYKWMYNDLLINDFSNESYENPKLGSYKVFVKDKNGCVGISESVQIK